MDNNAAVGPVTSVPKFIDNEISCSANDVEHEIMSFLSKKYVCSSCASLSAASRSLKLLQSSASSQRYYGVKSVVRDGRPFRLAVIGSGPAGFYTAYKVMSKIENAKVDMYEHLPVPFGLVRFGVAPDHPEVKNCEEKFREVAESPNFTFIGNIAIGTEAGSLPLKVLAPHYDAILFAYGASKDRTLGIPGENELNGVCSARAFVGWYNGLPEYADLKPDLDNVELATVIGQGNVALDVARILLSDVDSLRKTDITEAALEGLTRNRIKGVRVVGRRGPMQAAFTIKEARELMRLPSVAFTPVDSSLIPEEVSKLPRAQRRIMELLKKGSETSISSASKSWSLDFRLSPISFNSSQTPSKRLSSISFEKTFLSPDAFDPYAKASGTGEHADLPTDIAFRSIGYKSEPLQGLLDLGIPFDERLGIIPNDQYGRVLTFAQGTANSMNGEHVPGMYCAGWVKRGPAGVIATTMNDAFSTADIIAQDWYSNAPFLASEGGQDATQHGWAGVKKEAEYRGCRRVSWQEWELVDKAERERGKAKGKEREKFTRIEDMLAVIN